jgi:hypothetical protein
LDNRSSKVRFPAGAGNFSLHHRVQNGSGAHPASYPMGTRVPFLGIKQSGREADHSPPSSAEVKECLDLYLHSPNTPSWRGAQLNEAQGHRWSRDSSIGIALGCELDDWSTRVRFPAGAGNFSLHHRVQNGSKARAASYPMGIGGYFSGVQRPHPVAESCTICNSRSRRPVRKLLDTRSYMKPPPSLVSLHELLYWPTKPSGLLNYLHACLLITYSLHGAGYYLRN